MGFFIFLTILFGIPLTILYLVFNPIPRTKILSKLVFQHAVAIDYKGEVRYTLAKKNPFGGLTADASIYSFVLNEDGTGRESAYGYAIKWVYI